jgi:hypothetical protein
MGFRLSPFRPKMRTGHHIRRAVGIGEVGYRPDGVELRFDIRPQKATPRQPVTVQGLQTLAIHDADQLGQVQLKPISERQQEVLARADDALIDQKRAAGRRPSRQGPGSGRVPAREIVHSNRGRQNVRHDFRPQSLQSAWSHRVINNERTILPERFTNVRCAAISRQVLKVRHGLLPRGQVEAGEGF